MCPPVCTDFDAARFTEGSATFTVDALDAFVVLLAAVAFFVVVPERPVEAARWVGAVVFSPEAARRVGFFVGSGVFRAVDEAAADADGAAVPLAEAVALGVSGSEARDAFPPEPSCWFSDCTVAIPPTITPATMATVPAITATPRGPRRGIRAAGPRLTTEPLHEATSRRSSSSGPSSPGPSSPGLSPPAPRVPAFRDSARGTGPDEGALDEARSPEPDVPGASAEGSDVLEKRSAET
ncbi:hypothetical protein Kisp02_71330 [Kineosporia sp. NBRC 101731]|nr:hypothetical protein Kisp02_71330 [Kineosporia sp. NBRC 101731]